MSPLLSRELLNVRVEMVEQLRRVGEPLAALAAPVRLLAAGVHAQQVRPEVARPDEALRALRAAVAPLAHMLLEEVLPEGTAVGEARTARRTAKRLLTGVFKRVRSQ